MSELIEARNVRVGDLSEGLHALSVRPGPAIEVAWGTTDGQVAFRAYYAPGDPIRVTTSNFAEKREALAQAIYDEGQDYADFWLSTVDGTPNSAAYAIATRLIEDGLA